jgi:hypothetical protein
MPNVSGIKQVKDIMISDELILYDKTKGGREKTIPLDEGRDYIVPEYQREINWSTENVQVLIDDLKKGKKFLGTITLSTSAPKQFEIIDGQQRLTVITLIITCLNESVDASKKVNKLCNLVNKSFPDFKDALEYRFDYEKIKEENLPLYNRIIANDNQNQKMDFARIWKSIVERVEILSVPEREDLLLALCESEINVIVNEIEGTDTQRKFCVDYFIDINNKSVELDSLDIIRAYAFKEDFLGMTERWVQIQKKCSALAGKVKYTREDLYYQYFICKVNKEIEYKISKLSNDYKIKEDVEVAGRKYASGTYIWNMFKRDKFYAQLLEELEEYLDFIEVVISSETGGEDNFKKYFYDEEGRLVDETRILNAHTIINSILRNDDLVPKMMVMKYYLEVLKPEKSNKSKYRIISNINIIATVFTLSSKRKGSELIASKIMLEEWQRGIREYATKIIQDVPAEIGYDKGIREYGELTKDSGLHAARRFLSTIDSCASTTGSLSINEEVFKIENNTSGDKNMEHFLINRERNYTIYLDDGETVDIEMKLPKRFKKHMATLANYILMDSEKNRQLKNRPVYEKIDMVESFIDTFGIDSIIPSSESQNHYFLIKKFLHDESKYPKRKLSETRRKGERRGYLREYYQKYFEDEYNQLVRGLKNADTRFLAKSEYYLKKVGFYYDPDDDGDDMTIELDTIFSNIKAEIDEKAKRIVISLDFYNPDTAADNSVEIYENLIHQVIGLFVDKFGEEPELHSSEEYCPDGPEENVFFIFTLEPKKVIGFIDVLNEISSEIA